jgi:hypothetical protein
MLLDPFSDGRSGGPVFDVQPRYSPELSEIAGHQAESVAQASGCDPEIVGSDELALSGEICPQSGMHSSGGNLDGEEGKASENSFHEGRSPSP